MKNNTHLPDEIEPSKRLRSMIPSRMIQETYIHVSCGEVLKVQPKTIVHTRLHKEENEESVGSSDDVPPTTQGEVASSFHITLCDETPIEGEDAEEAPHELEEGVRAVVDELKEVDLGTPENPRPIFISALLSDEDEEIYEMPGLDPKVAVHRLAVKKGCRPVKQAQRCFCPELIPSIETEVNKLIEAGFIREVKYPTWISNIVPVRKKNGQIRVCVDFRDLNVACPKDDFSLPITELMIDAVTGHEIMSFMDGATCQRAMQTIFDDMLHKMVECYVDDLVVKSKLRTNHLVHLRQVFDRLRKFQLKMNPLKCAFGVAAGKFLGFTVRNGGIEIEQPKIDAIIKMPSQETFMSLKAYMPPVLTALIHGRPLILYISAQDSSVGSLLAQENEKGKENALYYLSRMMTPNELKYSPIEKLCLALVFAIKKLKHYFEAHTIRLVSKANPVKYVMAKKSVKGKGLADFLADHPIPAEWELSNDLPDEDVLVIEVLPPWNMYFDGASHREGAGAGVVFVTPEGELRINIYGDSKLIINQVLGLYEVEKAKLVPYNNYAKILMQWLGDVTIEHIPRKENKQAGALAALISTIAHPAARVQVCQRWVVPPIFNEDRSIDETVELPTASVYDIGKDDWRQPLVDYLTDGKLPEDPRKRVDIKRRAPRFIYYKETLYRRSFEGVFLRCLGKEEVLQAMQEAHSGVCGAHQSGPKLHFHIKRMGYYWPTMVKDCIDYARRCQACQYHANFFHQPPEPLHPTIASWPFDAWGLDVVGPITPKSSARHAYILAATDYFSKWAEAVALKEVKKENFADFLCVHIVYRFGIPRYILTDNGKPFDNKLMDKICKLFDFK
ncbi:PREDICTED: uncharacterized protein LOC109154689 [Ipomoea nil]|uniref:uncharacterized protein LOC109154689 n=1 Tax=Ipomoea nil TaxID=35883 RepID=UPI000901488B|nr:PREDICTED: uncharacterized protein LOC109154689 [Ipomoea nil]